MNKYEEFFKDNPKSNYWGVEILRDTVLPDLLDQDLHDIMYWAGRDLAIQYPLRSLSDLPAFFAQSQFGDLVEQKGTPEKVSWKMGGPIVKTRLKLNQNPDFMLETGFLAQTKQQIDQVATEAQATVRMGSVRFTAVSDPDEPRINPKNFHFIDIAK